MCLTIPAKVVKINGHKAVIQKLVTEVDYLTNGSLVHERSGNRGIFSDSNDKEYESNDNRYARNHLGDTGPIRELRLHHSS